MHIILFIVLNVAIGAKQIALVFDKQEYVLGEEIELVLAQSTHQFNFTLTNPNAKPMLLTVADDKHAHLYLQGRRRLELPSNTPVTLTFTAYCPFTDDDEVATRRQITFTHQTSEYHVTILKECHRLESESNLAFCTVAIVLSVMSILIALIAVVIYLLIQRRAHHHQPDNLASIMDDDEECLLSTSGGVDDSIPRKSIRLLKTIQEGKLGVIYHAELVGAKGKNRPCLIKAVTKNTEDVHDEKQGNSYALLEASLLRDSRQLIGLKHKHICSLIGQINDELGDAMAVFPWIENGNLKLFLRRCQLRTPTSRPSAKSSVSTFDLISIAQQAADALAFLDEQRIIHGDIASRNCQLGTHNQFYLCDAALSTDLFPADYEPVAYNGLEYKVPVRWSPPERLDVPTQISLKGDVWSFGMFLWELLSLAREPYSDIEPDRIHTFLQNGYRAVKPLGCPDELYELMTTCWQYQLEQRPQTRDLEARLETIKHNHIL